MTHTVFDPDQVAFRFKADAETLASTTWLAAENTNISIVKSNKFRVRFECNETGGAGDTQADTRFGLYFQKNGSGGYIQMGLSTELQAGSTTTYFNQADTNDRLTTTSGIDVGYASINHVCVPGVVMGANETWELEYSLRFDTAAVVPGDYFDIRLYIWEGGTTYGTINAYDVTPRVTVATEPFQPTLAAFRGRYDSETLASTSWLAAENTNFSVPIERPFRVRFEVNETGGDLGDPDPITSATQFNLETRKNGGAWEQVDNSSPLRYAVSVQTLDTTDTTDRLTTTTGIDLGYARENNGTIRPTTTVIAAGDRWELEWTMELESGGSDTDYYELRVTIWDTSATAVAAFDSGGDYQGSYTYIPRIDVAPDFKGTQAAFRGKDDSETLASTTWLAAENTNFSVAKNTPFRVRFEINNPSGGSDPYGDPSTTYGFFFRKNGAGGWTQLGVSTDIQYTPSAQTLNITDTVDRLTTTTGITQGEAVENTGTTNMSLMATDDKHEIEITALLDSSVSNSDTFELKMYVWDSYVNPGYVAMDSGFPYAGAYTNVPVISITGAGDTFDCTMDSTSAYTAAMDTTLTAQTNIVMSKALSDEYVTQMVTNMALVYDKALTVEEITSLVTFSNLLLNSGFVVEEIASQAYSAVIAMTKDNSLSLNTTLVAQATLALSEAHSITIPVTMVAVMSTILNSAYTVQEVTVLESFMNIVLNQGYTIEEVAQFVIAASLSFTKDNTVSITANIITQLALLLTKASTFTLAQSLVASMTILLSQDYSLSETSALETFSTIMFSKGFSVEQIAQFIVVASMSLSKDNSISMSSSLAAQLAMQLSHDTNTDISTTLVAATSLLLTSAYTVEETTTMVAAVSFLLDQDYALEEIAQFIILASVSFTKGTSVEFASNIIAQVALLLFKDTNTTITTTLVATAQAVLNSGYTVVQSTILATAVSFLLEQGYTIEDAGQFVTLVALLFSKNSTIDFIANIITQLIMVMEHDTSAQLASNIVTASSILFSKDLTVEETRAIEVFVSILLTKDLSIEEIATLAANTFNCAMAMGLDITDAIIAALTTYSTMSLSKEMATDIAATFIATSALSVTKDLSVSKAATANYLISISEAMASSMSLIGIADFASVMNLTKNLELTDTALVVQLVNMVMTYAESLSMAPTQTVNTAIGLANAYIVSLAATAITASAMELSKNASDQFVSTYITDSSLALSKLLTLDEEALFVQIASLVLQQNISMLESATFDTTAAIEILNNYSITTDAIATFVGGLIFNELITTNVNGNIDTLASIIFDKDFNFDQTISIIQLVSLTLTNSLLDSMNATAEFSTNIPLTLDITAELSASGILGANINLTLDESVIMDQVGIFVDLIMNSAASLNLSSFADFANSLNLGVNKDMQTQGNYETLAALVLNIAEQMSSSALKGIILAALQMDQNITDSVIAVGVLEGQITLSSVYADSALSQYIANAGLTLGQVIGLTAVCSAIMDAGIEVSSILSISNLEGTTTIILETPAHRTITIRFEDRVTIITEENRVLKLYK